MSPRAIRRAVIAVCVAGIAGMIAGSIADNNGTAITFGLVTAVAVIGLILVTSVAGPDAFRRQRPPVSFDEEQGADVEARVQHLVERGADEAEVRELVRSVLEVARTVQRR